MTVDTPYDFHLRAKHDLYQSLLDDIDLENAAANYQFSKMNLKRHGLFEYNHAEYALSYAADGILKSKWMAPYRDVLSEYEGLSDEAWIPRMTQFVDGHNNPRSAHSKWPNMDIRDSDVAYGSLGLWDLSPLMENSEWGQPQWLQTLASSWEPSEDSEGNITNYHTQFLEPGVHDHERNNKDSFHRNARHLGRHDMGDLPSDIYERHFGDWLNDVASDEIKNAEPIEQRRAHLNQYKRVWAGLEPDPLGDLGTENPDHALGFLGYGFGMEWLRPNHRDEVIQHISKHGMNPSDNSVKMPHMQSGWLNRNWMGRYLGGEVMHRLRGMDAPSNGLPTPHYSMDMEQKENFLKRRYLEALRETLVYGETGDTVQQGLVGRVPTGYFDEDGHWRHSPNHEDAHGLFDKRERKTDAPHYIDGRTQRALGVESLYDKIIRENGGVLPRHVGEEGERKLGLRHTISNLDPFTSVQEFLDYDGAFLDEDQFNAVQAYVQQLGFEYERRKQVNNGMSPYLNMHHYSGGDIEDVRLSPYALFMAPHHSVGGHAADAMNPLSELHHMFHPDTWGNPDGSGLFTYPDDVSASQYAMTVEQGMNPTMYPKEIWPEDTAFNSEGNEAEDGMREREPSMKISLPIQGEPKDEMQSLVGLIADQPTDALDFGGHANVLAGNTKHWPQLATSFEPAYHDQYGRVVAGGPLTVEGASLDDKGAYKTSGSDETEGYEYQKHRYPIRRSLTHILSPGGKGRANEKKKAMLNSLWLGFNRHPSEGAFLNTAGQNVGGNISQRTNQWSRDLQQLVREQGLNAIPGHDSNQDLNSRVKQFMIHADLGRELEQRQPLPLLQERQADPWSIEEGAYAPGDPLTDSQSDIGWLDDDPGSWHLYHDREGSVDKGRFYPEQVNFGGSRGVEPHRFAFPHREAALQAQTSGEAPCPVCNGDGRIDPEDVAKADSLDDWITPTATPEETPDLLDFFDTHPDPPTGQECPNCEGSGVHQLSDGATSARVAPSPQQNLEAKLTDRLEAWLETPEDERMPEEWMREQESQLESLHDPQQYKENFQDRRRQYNGQKMFSTIELVQRAAQELQNHVRKQFETDGLDDPFGPDENGDWSQAHVNAMQLWRHANDWVLRAQPEHRTWDNDSIFGMHMSENDEIPVDKSDMMAGASVYIPHGGKRYQTTPSTLPMSIFNSSGYRHKFGWKVSPTFGVGFDFYGKPTVLHNQGTPLADKIPLLNVPFDHVQSIFPDMQPMSNVHPSAPSGDDNPESQKKLRSGESAAFKMSEDEPTVSNLLKALTNPDILKDDIQLKPVKAAHRIFNMDDLKHLRGFSGDWVVSTWHTGRRVIIHKKNKNVDAIYADGTKCRLSKDMRQGLKDANSDSYVVDAIVTKTQIIVLDLLEHGHKELYEEPLKDRIAKMRQQFESTDAVMMPAPFNTRRTDDDGLEQAVENLEDEEHDGILLRDAISTYMKGESRHPKWVLYRSEKEIDALILDRRGRGPFMYRLGIGPINPQKAENIGNRAVERNGKWYMDIGTLLRERRPYEEGEYVQIAITSVTHKEREGEDVYDIQGRKIICESATEATDSTETLGMLTKSYGPLIFPHDIVVNSNNVEVHLHNLEDTVIYKMEQWNDSWMLHAPYSLMNDLSNSDYAVEMSESLRPFWEPVVGMTVNGLVKLDYDPRETEDKGRNEDEDGEGKTHEVSFKIKKPKKMDDDQILKPNVAKMVIQALTLIEESITKERSTWTGARGLGIGLGTPDSAPRGPTELTSDSNTLDYDMRERDEDKEERPTKNSKVTGEPRPLVEELETEEGETGEIRVTPQEAVVEMDPE